MTEELYELSSAIRQALAERDLISFDGAPNISKLSSVMWNGDWLAFLNLAQRSGVCLVYIYEQRYNPYQFVFEVTKNSDLIDYIFSDDTIEDEVIGPINLDSSNIWLADRIRERIDAWQDYEGRITRVCCIWIKDNVAHYWQRYVDWFLALRAEIISVMDEAKQVKQQERNLRSQEAAIKLHEYATRLAYHPRFSEATSEEKREFMASQLFPEIMDADDLGYRPTISIAKRAALIYWWDVAPRENVAKAERVQELYGQGESIRNIAAILKMSEAKVKAALKNTNLA